MRYLSILIAGFCLVLLSGCQQQQAQSATMPAGPPPAPVSVVKAAAESIPTELRVVGTVDASSIVQVKSQVAGQLLRVDFTEGQNVRQGELLFEIDPRPFEEALRQAEAAVVRDRAQVAQGEASLARDAAQADFARTDAARYAELQKAGVVSKSQYDQSQTNARVSSEAARATQATIDSARAALQADQAAVEAAKLNLSYCRIQAPISGRTGNLLVHAGNLVKVNDAPLVVIHRLAPIFVNFSVPEQHLATVRRLSAAHKLPVRVFTRDNPGQAAVGALSVIDNTVDSTTGTIKLKATFDNADARLWPGQFVNVVLTLDTIQNATVIPAAAVQAGQQGHMVYVVKPNHTAEMRIVTVRQTQGTKVIIDKGVEPGDTVVTDGQMRLYPGAPVRVVDAVKLDAADAPPSGSKS